MKAVKKVEWRELSTVDMKAESSAALTADYLVEKKVVVMASS